MNLRTTTMKMKRQLVAMFLGITLVYGGAPGAGQAWPDSYTVSCDPGACSGTGGAVLDSAPQQGGSTVSCDPGACSGTGGAILDSAPQQDGNTVSCDPGGCSGTGGAR